MPKVSVIIPIYNTENYLRECLDSVISQTLSDIEIICVNDGSTDNSLDILKEYSQKDERIVLIDKENEGVGITRNKGISVANGEYVIFMDPDDLYPTNDILETLYNKAKENNVKICGGEFSHFVDGAHEYNQKYSANLAGYLFEKDKRYEYKEYQFDYGYHRFIYDRDFLVTNNILFPNYKRFQDPPFFVKAMIMAGTFYGVHKISYAYRYGHNIVKWSEEKVLDMMQGVIDNFNYAKQEKLPILEQYTYLRFLDHFYAIKENLTLKVTLKLLQMTFSENKILNLAMKKFIQQIFSVINKDKHKVITILGIKLSIRRKNAKN